MFNFLDPGMQAHFIIARQDNELLAEENRPGIDILRHEVHGRPGYRQPRT